MHAGRKLSGPRARSAGATARAGKDLAVQVLQRLVQPDDVGGSDGVTAMLPGGGDKAGKHRIAHRNAVRYSCLTVPRRRVVMLDRVFGAHCGSAPSLEQLRELDSRRRLWGPIPRPTAQRPQVSPQEASPAKRASPNGWRCSSRPPPRTRNPPTRRAASSRTSRHRSRAAPGAPCPSLRGSP